MTKEHETEFIDLSLVDRVRRRRSYYNDHTGETLEQEKQTELEDLMGELEPYIGDGMAKLTVSGALSSSKEFHKAEAFVSISVSCNNNLKDIEAVHDVIRPRVAQLTKEDHDDMAEMREEILSPGRLGKTASPPSKTTARSAKIVTKGVGAKPNFGR